MSALTQCSPSQLIEFWNIEHVETPTKSGNHDHLQKTKKEEELDLTLNIYNVQTEDANTRDLLIDANTSIEMAITSGKTNLYRDIVVLGNLNICSSDPGKIAYLNTRNCFVAGSITLSNDIVHKCEHREKFENIAAFRDRVRQLILEWIKKNEMNSHQNISLKQTHLTTLSTATTK